MFGYLSRFKSGIGEIGRFGIVADSTLANCLAYLELIIIPFANWGLARGFVVESPSSFRLLADSYLAINVSETSKVPFWPSFG